jgi:hypothetical protein
VGNQHEDDLFAPSLGGGRAPVPPAGERPWRLGSQFYVAFFGGPIAAGLVGYLNGRRLGLPSPRLAAIAAVGLASLAAVAVAVAVVGESENRSLRLLSAVGGIVAYLGIRQLQQDADRRYGVGRHDDESYDSLWLPGLGIVLLGGVAAAIVLAVVAR